MMVLLLCMGSAIAQNKGGKSSKSEDIDKIEVLSNSSL